jgi:hypothetical protein
LDADGGSIFNADLQMFADLKYQKVLMPLTISNHSTLQAVFNDYREKLVGEHIAFPSKYASRFESLKQKKFFILCHKE